MINFTNQEFMMFTGQAFLWLLVGVLIITPILRIKYKPLQRKRLWLIKIRRWLGVTSGLVALSHFVFWLFMYSSGWQFILNSFTQWFAILGWITLLIILLLTVTSNDYSVRRLKQKWKKIHKLTYLLPVLVVLHALTALKNWPIDLFIGWISVFAILLAYRVESLRPVLLAFIGIAIITNALLGLSDHRENLPAELNNIERQVLLHEIDTSHPDYYDIWWETAYRRNFNPQIKYSKRAKEFCKGSYPVSIGERPLYCADGRKKYYESK